MASRIFLGLVHYPIYNKNEEIITTSVTNLDIHDIARCCATYELDHYYIIHPLSTQHQLVQEIITYWQKGYGAVYNADRKKALDLVALKESIEAVKQELEEGFPGKTYIVVTDAKKNPRTVNYKDFRCFLEDDEEKNILLLFGTGWGLTKEVVEQADYVLEPIYGRGEYNHLSVRSAVAIISDRLLGEKWW